LAEDQNKFRRRVVFGDHTLGVSVVMQLNSFLGEVSEGLPFAGDGPDGGVNDDDSTPDIFQREVDHRPEEFTVFLDPRRTGLEYTAASDMLWAEMTEEELKCIGSSTVLRGSRL
jgi:hypothetical protein